MIVKDRQQMAQLLSERMTRTYTTLSERQLLEPDTSLVKTYLIEAHLPESAETAQALTLAEKVFSASAMTQTSQMLLHKAAEPTLLSIETSLREERFVIYVDFTNPRFWYLHSMGSSNAMDWVIKRLVKTSPELDRAWLPADLLECVSQMGAFRGLSLDYDRRVVPDIDFQSPEAPVEFLKMQLWGNKAADVLRILRRQDAFPHETTLAKVKVKFWLDDESDNEFSLDDIKYDGKVTARGTSFHSHMTLVSYVFELYAKQIKELEEKYALTAQELDGRLFIEGEPISFVFERPITNLKIFCDSIFSCSEPFRLWGVPIALAEDFYRVEAVDLHIASPLQFEVAPEFLRVYLPSGSCGNSIMRLYTNLQHHYDSLVKVEDGNGEPVFKFQPHHD